MKIRLLVCLLVLSLLFSGCTKGPARPTNLPTVTLPAATEPTRTEPDTEPAPTEPQATEPSEPEPTDEPEPDGGDTELPSPGFTTGTIMEVDGLAFIAMEGGIFFYEEGNPWRISEIGWNVGRNFSTDGHYLYYINEDNYLKGEDLYESTAWIVSDYIPGIPTLQAVYDGKAYVEIWSEDSEWYPNIYEIDLATGGMTELPEPYEITNRNGFLILRSWATDVSPRRTWIYDNDGNQILAGDLAWRTGFEQGELWYSGTDEDYGTDHWMDYGVHLYAWRDGQWVTLFDDVPAVADEFYGATIADNHFVTYGNYSVEAYQIPSGDPVSPDTTDFVRSLQRVESRDGYKFYVTQDAFLIRNPEGYYETAARAGEDEFWQGCAITDCFYGLTYYGELVICELP